MGSGMKLQAALDFISTYGFMIALLSVAIVILAAIAVRPTAVLPSQCNSFGDIHCNYIMYDVNSVSSSSTLATQVVNSESTPVNILSFNVVISGNTLAATCTPTYIVPGENTLCLATMNSAALPGTQLNGEFYMNLLLCNSGVADLNQQNCDYIPISSAGTFTAYATPSTPPTPTVPTIPTVPPACSAPAAYYTSPLNVWQQVTVPAYCGHAYIQLWGPGGGGGQGGNFAGGYGGNGGFVSGTIAVTPGAYIQLFVGSAGSGGSGGAGGGAYDSEAADISGTVVLVAGGGGGGGGGSDEYYGGDGGYGGPSGTAGTAGAGGANGAVGGGGGAGGTPSSGGSGGYAGGPGAGAGAPGSQYASGAGGVGYYGGGGAGGGVGYYGGGGGGGGYSSNSLGYYGAGGGGGGGSNYVAGSVTGATSNSNGESGGVGGTNVAGTSGSSGEIEITWET